MSQYKKRAKEHFLPQRSFFRENGLQTHFDALPHELELVGQQVMNVKLALC